MSDEIEWACPKCGADHNGHSKAKESEDCHSQSCMGFVCECEEDESADMAKHGTVEDPCHGATCYHCGWGGTFPIPVKGLLPWEKKAIEAGWTMPEKRKAELVALTKEKLGGKKK